MAKDGVFTSDEELGQFLVHVCAARPAAPGRGTGQLCVTVEPMIDNRPQADRILVAQLMGEARHHAKWRELTGAEHAAAVAGLRELAAGRADLLAEVAGILEGFHEGEPREPLARQAAQLCRDAGADPVTDTGLDRRRAPACRSGPAAAVLRWPPPPVRGRRDGYLARAERRCAGNVVIHLHPLGEGQHVAAFGVGDGCPGERGKAGSFFQRQAVRRRR